MKYITITSNTMNNIFCNCHLIDWSGKDKKYIHISSGEIYDPQKHGALDCREKVNERTINYETYFNICKYIPGDPKSHFPSVQEKLKNKETGFQEGIPPISKRLFK